MAYVAYLRVYEPLAAFHEPERSRWAGYVASAARPHRADALRAEQTLSLRQAISGVDVPKRESEHAYVRRVAGTVYVCPWQVRLRCLISGGAVNPGGVVYGGVMNGGAARVSRHPAVRPHIRSRGWSVPLSWFVLFGGEERWVALGRGSGPSRGPGSGSGSGAVRAAAQAGRALIYATPMTSARQRLARGLVAVRSLRGSQEAPDPLAMEADLAELSCWLERFHPGSLVELDYGGLVYLFSDEALYGDESVAEVAAALEGIVRDRREVAAGMLARVRSRWRRFQAFEQVN